MPSRYEHIKSPYIRERLQQTSWENHEYIDNLVRLALYLQRGPHSMAGGYEFNFLQNKFPEETRQLRRELNVESPVLTDDQDEKVFKNYLAQAMAREVERKAAEEAAAKTSWLRAGGLE